MWGSVGPGSAELSWQGMCHPGCPWPREHGAKPRLPCQHRQGSGSTGSAGQHCWWGGGSQPGRDTPKLGHVGEEGGHPALHSPWGSRGRGETSPSASCHPCLSPQCWETCVGQDLYRFMVMDFVFILLDTIFGELVFR